MKQLRTLLAVVFVALATCLSAIAQNTAVQPVNSKRFTNDPRNIAPTIGTGGAIGGPTGLFTVYDAQTLRKGEYTLAAAFSNYDRDPGNVDISEIPISFQIGLNNYVEVFFSTEAYRAIKVNNPQNLSSFYLPNSRVNGALLPALVLAPAGSGGGNGAIFRPSLGGLQPFTTFPFVGGTFISALPNGARFTIGAPVGGNGSTAAQFPGLGSIYGGILPGIVLSTTQVAGATTLNTFTLAPSYLPDAPFINRTYGESSFDTFNFGGKIRLNSPNKPVGVAVLPFARLYADKADSASGFNQLQRGASPGGNRVDFGAYLVGDARVAKYLNISANIGYTYNSSVKGTFPSGKFTILDRPDELTSAVGADFPVNKYFQPIGEFRATKYVGGRTPNALQQNPVDVLGGVRIFPTRYFSITGAYRYNVNQQKNSIFNSTSGNTTNFVNGVPRGFVASTDANGFMAGVSLGRRNERQDPVKPNTPPTITNVTVSDQEIVLPCPAGTTPAPGSTCNDSTTVTVNTTATDPDGDQILYQYTTSAGRVTGSGPTVQWDLSGAQPGTYTISVGADDGCGVCNPPTTREVRIVNCPNCVNPAPPCPTGLAVTAQPDTVTAGQTVTFTGNVNVNGTSPTFNWTVSGGRIVSGQGTPSITVDTTGLTGSVTGTANLGNVDPSCQSTASATAQITGLPTAQQVDEYGQEPNDRTKARLDTLATQLGSNPGASIVVIAYGTAKGGTREAQRRLDFATNYLVKNRQVDTSRIRTVNGGVSANAPRTTLYIVPSGAQDPTPTP